MNENKVRARLTVLRKRLEQAKEREDYGVAAFIAGQIFERELILEDMLSWDDRGTEPHAEYGLRWKLNPYIDK